MSIRRGTLGFLGMAVLAIGVGGAEREGRPLEPFRLQAPREGKLIDLGERKGKVATVVVFLGTECPVANAFLPVLAKLHEEYAPKGVAFVGVNSNQQDTRARVAAHARKHDLPFPVVNDPDHKVADDFGAKRTPEAFVLDRGLKVAYQGRIDDQFGLEFRRPGKPTRRDLAVALDELLAGKAVSVAKTNAAGCLISRRRPTKEGGEVTYAKHVSRILQKNCQECHRPGQIGPMSLLGYDDAVAWGGMMREVVSDGRMPPWHADPKHGKWRNDRRLSAEEKKQLLAWLDGGMPKGDEKDMPPARRFSEGWRIGKPDVVFTMPKPYRVPAEAPKGGVPYQYFSVPTNFDKDMWVERAEAKAGATEVVHHIIAFIVAPGERFRMDTPGAVLCGMAPGEVPSILGPGEAKLVPAGSRLVLQMHYTPNGKAQDDQSQVGLVFAKAPPRHRALTVPIHNPWFLHKVERIPAGAANHKIEATHTFREDVRVTSFMPHMHLRGKDFLIEAQYPDGKKEVLLRVPRWDFHWQTGYRAAEPIRLPRGTRLRCVAHFDNSPGNPNNPDASKAVYWGDQTWEEMMVGWTEYYVEGAKP